MEAFRAGDPLPETSVSIRCRSPPSAGTGCGRTVRLRAQCRPLHGRHDRHWRHDGSRRVCPAQRGGGVRRTARHRRVPADGRAHPLHGAQLQRARRRHPHCGRRVLLRKPHAIGSGGLPHRLVLLDRQHAGVLALRRHLCAHHPKLLLPRPQRGPRRPGHDGALHGLELPGAGRGAEGHYGDEHRGARHSDRGGRARGPSGRTGQLRAVCADGPRPTSAHDGHDLYLVRGVRSHHGGRRRDRRTGEDDPAGDSDYARRGRGDLRAAPVRNDGRRKLHGTGPVEHPVHLYCRRAFRPVGPLGGRPGDDHGEPLGL